VDAPGANADYFSAHVPLPVDEGRLASIELVAGGKVVATRARSAHAPAVTLVAPAAGTHIPGRGSLDVRWQATDPDGGELDARVDYSADDGRTWRVVWTGPSTGLASLSGEFFEASKQARLRVRVDDGFSDAVAVSGRFQAAGRPPEVKLLGPTRSEHLTVGTPVYLSAQALDDAGRPLVGRSLRWFDGRRALGRGPRQSALLSRGRHVLTVTARDRLGRVARARVVVRVGGQRPAFLLLSAPHRLRAKARTITLRVASTIPSSLVVGKRRLHVDRHARRVTIRIARRGLLRLPLRLVAGGFATTTLLVVRRA
jgi:hypothetical protein